MKAIHITAFDSNGRKVYFTALKQQQTKLEYDVILDSNETPCSGFYDFFNCFVDSEKFKYIKHDNIDIFEYSLGKLSREEMAMHLMRATKSPKFQSGEVQGYCWMY